MPLTDSYLAPYKLNNKHRIPRTPDGKCIYRYPNKKVKVDEKTLKLLFDFDRQEYNNDHKEFRHRKTLVSSYVDTDYDYSTIEGIIDETTVNCENEIINRLDEEKVISSLSALDKKIYYLSTKKGYSQEKTAKLLKEKQSTISRRLKKIFYKLEYEALNDGTKTDKEIRFEILWNTYNRTGKDENFNDFLVEYFITFVLSEQDYFNFIGWFYSVRELRYFAMKYLVIEETNSEEYVKTFLQKVSKPLCEHFLSNYGEQPILFQVVYIKLFTEMYRRMQLFPTPKGKMLIEANQVLRKTAKRLKLSVETLLQTRLSPYYDKRQVKRNKEFYKKFSK